MKKSYIALGAIAIALSSCSSDSLPADPNNPNGGQPGDNTPVPVSLGIASSTANVSVSNSRTRGTGTVGSTDGTTKWQYENLYVLMTTDDTRALEASDIINAGTDDEAGWGFTSFCGTSSYMKRQFDGSFWARPVLNGTKYVLNYKLDPNEQYASKAIDRYYPLKGGSDFFAYYIDDAMPKTADGLGLDPAYYSEDLTIAGTGTGHKYPLITKAADYMTVKYQLNGSQDLLFGKAERFAGYEDGFSAKSSRAGKVPSIVMNHMLTRFTFQITKGADDASQSSPTYTKANKVTINSIKVKSKSKGTMLVAYNPDANSIENTLTTAGYKIGNDFKLVWDATETTPATFTLMKAGTGTSTEADGKEDLVALGDVALGDATYGSQSSFTIGEAMFVKPDEEQYTLEITYTFTVREAVGNVGDEGYKPAVTEQMTQNLILQAPVVKDGEEEDAAIISNTFLQGKSYRINITVYGLEPVVATATLENWKDGGDIEFGGDEDVNNQ